MRIGEQFYVYFNLNGALVKFVSRIIKLHEEMKKTSGNKGDAVRFQAKLFGRSCTYY